MDEDSARRKRTRLLQRYLLNPPMKALVWLGLSPGHVLVETRGRRSGRLRRNVIGMLMADGRGWVVAEQGRHAGWVLNAEAHPQVRVRVGRRWRPAVVTVLPDDDAEARLDGFARPGHAEAVRRFGTQLTTVRFDF